MRMLCYKCNHPWNYRGKNTEEKDNITCPKCMYKLVLGKALIEGPSEQKLLTNLPNKKPLPNKLPSLLPSKLPTTNEFERVILEEGMEVLVEKRIAKQFKEAPEYLDEEIECVIEQVDPIRVTRILPAPEIKILPGKTLLEIIEHQRSYY